MTAITRAPGLPGAGTRSIPRLAWLGAAAAVLLLWMVTMEGSAVSSAVGGTAGFLHELFHDGRHLLGVPCH